LKRILIPLLLLAFKALACSSSVVEREVVIVVTAKSPEVGELLEENIVKEPVPTSESFPTETLVPPHS